MPPSRNSFPPGYGQHGSLPPPNAPQQLHSTRPARLCLALFACLLLAVGSHYATFTLPTAWATPQTKSTTPADSIFTANTKPAATFVNAAAGVNAAAPAIIPSTTPTTPVTPAGPAPAKVAQALAKAFASLNVQKELPLDPKKEILPEKTGGTTNSILTFFINNAKAILWGTTIFLVLIILLNMRGSLWSNSRAKTIARTRKKQAAYAATMARMETAGLHAEGAAAKGNYAEAMHILLLQSVGELRKQLTIPIAASLTSREILYRVTLPEQGRASFAAIIQQVEVSWFGNHTPGKAEYTACLHHFQELAKALGHSLTTELPAQQEPEKAQGPAA